MISEKLQPIFNTDYPGIDVFISEVLRPVLGNDIEMKNQNLTDDDLYKTRAQNAGIKRLDYIADIFDKNYSSDKISLFDVTVDNRVQIERSRVNIQTLIRSIVQYYSHILIVFHYEDVADEPWRFSYAYKQGTLDHTTSARRFTYVFGKGYRGRTAADRFEILANSQHRDEDFIKAFSVEALSDDFFDKYRKIYADFVEFITGCRYEKVGGKWEEQVKHDPNPQFESTFEGDKKLVRDYIKKMLGRIVFLYFLQRKKWLGGNLNYMNDLWESSNKKDNFHNAVLRPLFFDVLNEKPENRSFLAQSLPNWNEIPYLNGGLFAEEDGEEPECIFSTYLFEELFNILNHYNFTIDENDLEDAEIGIDPEMLGRIFENLLEDNKDKGTYYTPKEIVEYMCREALITYLCNGYVKESHPLIRKFVETLDGNLLNDRQKEKIGYKLKVVKICDPAIGSGAFPMGLVNLLFKLHNTINFNSIKKREIIENNIYGVDIEKGAVDIARLRFWLSIIVEEDLPRPLPNLHFKIMQGNSLLEGPGGADLSDLVPTSITGSLFQAQNSTRRDLLYDIKNFYSTTDHQERDVILERIRRNIRRQIIEKKIEITGDIDPSANNQFFLWHTWFLDVFDNGGFDIVIANPPYIKEYTSREAFNGFRETSKYYMGKMDLWYGFACQAIDHLKSNGVLCFIATNNWVTNNGAFKLRNKILSDTKLQTLIDFNNFLIFEESASIQTMILLLTKVGNLNSYRFEYRKLTKPNPQKEDAIALLSLKESKINQGIVLHPIIDQSKLRNNIFNFSTSESDNILDSLLHNAQFLLSEEIGQGIIGAPDECFLVNNKKDFSIIEQQFLKPYYTGLADRYVSQPSSAFIIYLSKKNFESSNLSSFVNLEKHFLTHKEILIRSKIKFKTPNKPYFFLHREREEHMFKKGYPKIICQGRCLFPRFYYTEDDYYASRALFVIQTPRFDMKFLTGLFNSKLIEFWLKNRGKKQGASFQVDKDPLLRIPIKTDSQVETKVASIVDQILDTKNNVKNSDTSSYEQEIDFIVYHLYGLTYDEVLIVDPDTPIRREDYESFKMDDNAKSE